MQYINWKPVTPKCVTAELCFCSTKLSKKSECSFFPRHSQTNFIMEKLSLYYCYLVLSINYIDTYSQSYHSYHSHQVNNHPYHYIQPDSNNFLSNYIGNQRLLVHINKKYLGNSSDCKLVSRSTNQLDYQMNTVKS